MSLEVGAVRAVRILIVEDNEQNQKLACQILGMHGFETDVAMSAEEGVALVGAGDFDVVLMDLQLPGMDGLEATRILKASPTTRHVPIIALTAFAHDSDREAALAAGCDGFVTKPYLIRELLTALRAQLPSPAPSAP